MDFLRRTRMSSRLLSRLSLRPPSAGDKLESDCFASVAILEARVKQLLWWMYLLVVVVVVVVVVVTLVLLLLLGPVSSLVYLL